MSSVRAIVSGMLLALVLGILVLFGIFAPILTAFVGDRIAEVSVFTGVVLIFSVAFAFYFGGMAASYLAPARRVLHGIMVSVLSFAISLLVNFGALVLLETDRDPIANLRGPGEILLTTTLVFVSVVASYVGARRGIVFYTHNQKRLRQREIRRERARKQSSEQT